MIDDPLARFYDEGPAPQAGIKNPVTGIRTEVDTAHRKQLRDDEARRKGDVSKRMITQLMSHELGREWLYDLLNSCNVFGNPYTTDPIRTAFNCGALFIGNAMHEKIKLYSIKEYMTMIEEDFERTALWEDLAADKK